MRVSSLAAALALTSAPLFAQSASMYVDALPERPAIPVANLDGERHLIVGYRGTEPVIVKDGSRLKARHANVSLFPGKAFGPGFVTIGKADARTETKTTFFYGSMFSNASTLFDAWFTADRDLPDVYYLLLVFEDLSEARGENPRVAILGTEVGGLKAGIRKSVNGTFPMLSSNLPLRWAALVFSAGVQIHCSGGNAPLDTLFDMVDHVAMNKAMAERSAGDYPAMLFRQFPLRFDDDLKAQFAGKAVTILLHIAPSGLLDYVEGDDPGTAALTTPVGKQVSHWLFLPRVKGGQPEPATVALPLQF